MRIFSYILLGFGILLLATSGYDEYRGITHAPSGGVSRYSFLSSSHEILTKTGNPEYFHNAMVVHWSRSLLLLLAGFILFMIDSGQDKVDPMSPDSDEKIDEELRKDELDEDKNK
jgi:hypothetical protein